MEGRGLVLACSLDPQYNHGQPYPQVGEDKQQADFFTTIEKMRVSLCDGDIMLLLLFKKE